MAYQPAMLGGRGVYLARSLKKLRIEDGASSLRLNTQTQSSAIKSESINLYPNPANNLLNIEFSSRTEGVLIIKDASERVYLHRYINDVNIQLNLEQLTSGIYFLEIAFENCNVEKRKLIILH